MLTNLTPTRTVLPLVFGLALVLSARSGYAQPGKSPQASSTLRGDALHPADARNWVETRLFFGLGPARPRVATEAAWQQFLDREVTPRFPAGLSVLNVYGQWQRAVAQGSRQDAPERLRSKMLLIEHASTPEEGAKIEAIRAAWKARTGDQSVLEVNQAVDVSF